MKNLPKHLLVLCCVVLVQACASPAQIVEDAFDQLKESPALEAQLEATPCGMAAMATASASTSAQGVRGTAIIIMRVEQECASSQTQNPNPAPIEAPASDANSKEVQ